MSIVYEERLLDSPYIETITRGQAVSAGSPIRPAEINWHMVLMRCASRDIAQLLVVGPWTISGEASYPEGTEFLWVRFKLGVFMPHLPTRLLLDRETILPEASRESFWLKGAAWQFPDYEDVETFVNRLVRDEVLVRDPIVEEVVHDHPPALSLRTVRQRFLRAAGLTHSHIRQLIRAQRAAALLRQGASILDTVYEVGYFDQPHLTRSLKQFIGYTPHKSSG